MTELKMLAAILAGSRLSYSGATGFQLKIGEEYLTGQDIQETARKLLDKEFFRFALRGAKYAVVTTKGMAALANMEVDATGYIYADPDYSKEIYVGTAFICRLCNEFASKDRTEVEAHIDTEHDDHNDPEEDEEPEDFGDDQDDYRPGGYYDQMDAPRNFNEPAGGDHE